MKLNKLSVGVFVATLAVAGCGTTGTTGTNASGGPYGQTGSNTNVSSAGGGVYDGSSGSYERYGRIAQIDTVNLAAGEKPGFGIGSVIGAVAGGLLGHQVGGGRGNTAATVAGAVAGGAAGHAIGDGGSSTAANTAQRVTVNMNTGGQVTIVQPPNPSLADGMLVAIVGSGESARVVPR